MAARSHHGSDPCPACAISSSPNEIKPLVRSRGEGLWPHPDRRKSWPLPRSRPHITPSGHFESKNGKGPLLNLVREPAPGSCRLRTQARAPSDALARAAELEESERSSLGAPISRNVSGKAQRVVARWGNPGSESKELFLCGPQNLRSSIKFSGALPAPPVLDWGGAICSLTAALRAEISIQSSRPSSLHCPPSSFWAQPGPLGIFHLPEKVLMTVSPCEALINLRGRWLRGDWGLWPYADEDCGSISCGGEGTPQTFLPAIKATWLSSVALGKEEKCSPLRKEINYVLYAWHEIQMGTRRWGTVGLLCRL